MYTQRETKGCNRKRRFLYDVNENYSNTIFWVGAGVDADWPTLLPVGNRLMRYVLHTVFPDEVVIQNGTDDNAVEMMYRLRANKLNEFGIYINEKHGRKFPLIHNGIRLETVISVVRSFESGASTTGRLVAKNDEKLFLDGFRSFAEAKPNEVHFKLAYFLHEGASVVTSNYDTCILKAYNLLYGRELRETRLTDQIYKYDDGAKSGRLYYYHGIATNPQSLGITLNTVDNVFKGEFADFLTDKYQSSAIFYFLGYGCVDDLDVNVMFQHFRDHYLNASHSKAVCVLYPDKNGQGQLTNSQKSLMECFHSYRTVTMKLPNYFQKYFPLSIKEDAVLRQKLDFAINEKTMDVSSDAWKRDFIIPDKEYLASINRQLDYTLGINREYKKLSSASRRVMKWHDHYYRFYTGGSFLSRFERALAPDFLNTGHWRCTVNQSIAFLYKPEGRDPKGRINWKFVTTVNHRCKELWKCYTISPWLVSKREVTLLNRTIETVLNQYDVGNFVEPRAMFVLYYDKARLLYILSRNWAKCIEWIFNGISMYQKTSELDGIANGIVLFSEILKQASKDEVVDLDRLECNRICNLAYETSDKQYGDIRYYMQKMKTE